MASGTGLPVSQVISINISLTPAAAAYENFDTLLVVGDSDVIDTYQRYRVYANIAAVGQDFTTTAPEYLAAEDFFSQTPNPTSIYIGRWAYTATHARLVGGVLSTADQTISNWTSITNGSFAITIDGTAENIETLNFSTVTNLNGVASIIQTAMQVLKPGSTCVFTAEGNFQFESGTTGTTSTMSFLTAVSPTSGTDISAQLLGTSTTAQYVVDGIVAETAASAVNTFFGLPQQEYGLMFATPDVQDSDYLAVAAIVQATGPNSGFPHIFGVTTNESAALSASATTDIGYELMVGLYSRSFAMYSSTSPYACAAIFGVLLTVDFAGENTMLNIMWQQILGVGFETLTSTEAAALNGKRYNYFALFNNGVSIVVNGTMAADYYIDEIFGMDAFANELQTDVFNLFATAKTKIPQTDPGVDQIVTTLKSGCEKYVTNGFLAPGVWTGASYGPVATGQTLSNGYLIYAPPVATQSAADRAARKSPSIQIGAIEAGAINTVQVDVSINR